MTYARPFVTPRFTAHEGDSWPRRLSLAVRVDDAFTRRMAVAPLRVYLKELRFLPTLRSLGGLFCFEGRRPGEGLPAGNYTLVVEPDRTTADFFFLQPEAGGQWSESFERAVALPVAGAQAPLVVVTLAPRPSYPFPAGATLVRGKVTQGGQGAAGAVVRCTYDRVDPADTSRTEAVTAETLADRAGEYVLFFISLPDPTQEVTVIAEKGGQSVQQTVDITEGATLLAGTLVLP